MQCRGALHDHPPAPVLYMKDHPDHRAYHCPEQLRTHLREERWRYLWMKASVDAAQGMGCHACPICFPRDT